VSEVRVIVNVEIAESAIVAVKGDPMDLLRPYLEKRPGRVYGIDRRLVRVVADEPWDFTIDVGQFGSHMDPLAQTHTARIVWVSRNLKDIEPRERAWAQSILNNIPEGALVPDSDDIALGHYVA